MTTRSNPTTQGELKINREGAAAVAEAEAVERISQTQALAPQDPSQLLALAVQKDLDLDKLERLMELQERWQKQQAKEAFFAALAKFQSTVPRIPRRKQGHNYKYAPLEDIDETIRPAMLECQLTKRWEIGDEKVDGQDIIRVTCFITHVAGHSETTTLSGLPDTSGSKNAIQSRGSTVAYLQRYTLIGALGLSTADEDIDARIGTNGAEKISTDQALYLADQVREVGGNMTGFLKALKVSTLEDLPLTQYGKAINIIAEKRKAQ